ncbi:sensor histidine kinase [Nitzschia inconspicua]|uniref:Sensor histidine kinase n=1 Tax=Nitzschia inconspicua TaxID=303405 RepID=A0A9K3LG83_9STRA|nr:sensor histidine kinase [Nitzschia inconspicua]
MSGKGVSDEEATRALLSSAEARLQEREGTTSNRDRSTKSGGGGPGNGNRGGQQWGNHNHNHDRGRRDIGSKRSRFNDGNGSSSSNHSNDNQRSYYGPSGDNDNDDKDRKRMRTGHDRRPRDTERRSRVVESEADDDDNNNHRTREKGEHHDEAEEEKPKPQYKPNFGLSGALAKDAQSGNVYKGVVLKFKEPPEARAPNTQWRFYVFKKGQKDVLETLHISKQSAYLMGRNTDIADIPMHHPSLSSQHAVLQYRALPNKEGRLSCQPYIMDLESTNGTFLNGVQIDAARYYQLKKGDVLTFGASTREYVLLTENTTSSSYK